MIFVKFNNFSESKLLWVKNHSIEKFLDVKKKSVTVTGSVKYLDKNFASVGLKTYMKYIFQIEQFF